MIVLTISIGEGHSTDCTGEELQDTEESVRKVWFRVEGRRVGDRERSEGRIKTRDSRLGYCKLSEANSLS